MHELFVSKVSIVANAKILERRKQAFVKSFGQTYFCTNLIIKVRKQANTVHALWCGCKTDEQFRSKLIENLSVTVCHKMMSLIYYYIVVIVVWQIAENTFKLRIEGLNRNKQMVDSVHRTRIAHPYISEVGIL